jgi:nickel transport protein
MGESNRAFLPALALVIATCGAASPASAHKLNVFAVVEGRTIRGEAYFRGGGPARGAVVTALGPAGQRLGNATTDDNGKFTIEAHVRGDHRLVVDAGAGHAGEYRIAADELPKELPAPDGPSPPAASEPESTASRPPAADPTPTAGPGPVPSDASASLEALRVQVVKLREDLDGFRNEIRLRDVIGGIGYIVGAMGLVLYVVARRRHRDV